MDLHRPGPVDPVRLPGGAGAVRPAAAGSVSHRGPGQLQRPSGGAVALLLFPAADQLCVGYPAVAGVAYVRCVPAPLGAGFLYGNIPCPRRQKISAVRSC